MEIRQGPKVPKPVKGTKRICDLDRAFARLIRKKLYCERCQRVGQEYECSHVIGRKNKALRWDIVNALCLCQECHRWWHRNPDEARAWFKEMFPGRWEYLEMTKNIIIRRTSEDYEELLDNIEAERIHKLTIDLYL